MRITTCQAPNCDHILLNISKYLANALGEPFIFVHDVPWEERSRMIHNGEIEIGWICSLPYTRETDSGTAPFELLAAPIRSGKRYEGKPICFSEIIIRSESKAKSMIDLRGMILAYNEPHSFSGYTAIRSRAASMREFNLFSKAIEAGSHEKALLMVRTGDADVAAIDSTMLEMELKYNPEIMNELRILDSIGPYPGAPLVIRKSLSPRIKKAIQKSLLNMHQDPAGQLLLKESMLSRFEEICDELYNYTRDADRISSLIRW